MKPRLSIKDTDKGWIELMKLKGMRGSARSGFVGEQAGKVREDGLTNAEVGMINEFGTEDGHVPERSFLRASFDANRQKYLAMFKRLTRAVYDGKITMHQALALLGELAARDTKALIRTSIPPPNAPSTIARKGSSTTLISSAQMINAITSVVDMGDKKGKG